MAKSTRDLLIQGGKLLGIALVSALAAIGIVGLIPVSIPEFASKPDPAEDYVEALRRLSTVQDDEQGFVSEASCSRLMTHGEKTARVYILIHGWTNSPRQWVEMGEMLHQRGHNVLILRMPYHGLESQSVSELKRIRLTDLWGYAEETVDIAAGLGDQVHVVGFSVGGTIAAWIAQNRGDVERVMVASSMFELDHLPSWLNAFLMNLFTRAPNVNLTDPEEPYREHVYRGQSSRGVAEVMRFGEGVFNQVQTAPSAVAKILLVTNGNDTTIDNRLAYQLGDLWERSGIDVVRHEFPTSLGMGHNMIDVSSNSKTDIVYGKILELLSEE